MVSTLTENNFRISTRVRNLQLVACFILLILYIIPYVTAKWDPYEVIGVDRNADLDRIKRAYRILARKLHPDKSNLSEDEAGRRFIELNRAFNILKDPNRRSRYDQHGDTGESRLDLVDRILWRFTDLTVRLLSYVTSKESFSTVVMLLVCAVIARFFLHRKPESSSMAPEYPTREHTFIPKTNEQKREIYRNVSKVDDLKIMELKAETYNGLVRLLRPGFRSIIVLTDRETHEKIIPKFKEAVWPYRKNNTLSFGFLCLDKNINWYKSLLQDVLGIDELKVNKKNCIGTVLSLNGFKRYIRVYHAKHHEIDCYDDDTDNDGSFLGFDDQEDLNGDIESHTRRVPSKVDAVYTVDTLLDRLPIWLDKMFDGLTKRYFLENWPEDMK